MLFSPFFPINPMTQTRAWGLYDPADYAQFGFNRHNGNDYELAPDKLIRAPFDYEVIRVDNQPKGGGIFVGIVSEIYDFPAFTCTTPEGNKTNFNALSASVLFDFLHCESISVKEGDIGKAGDILAIADNTGFSTGSHTHIQARRGTFNKDQHAFFPIDTNDAHNSFDPTQFYNGLFADHIQVAEQAVVVAKEVIAAVQNPQMDKIPLPEKVGLLQALINLLKSIWTQ